MNKRFSDSMQRDIKMITHNLFTFNFLNNNKRLLHNYSDTYANVAEGVARQKG